MSEPSTLLISDDSIESAGFRALYDVLSEFADVTMIVSAMDQSAVGRKMSTDAVVAEHGLGYVLEGTPADCTVAGLEALCLDVGIIVSGINKGTNVGAYVLGRSETVSAAVEATFFDVPAIALSLYIPAGDDLSWHEKVTDPRDFREVTNTTSYPIKHAEPAGVFEQCDYLSVNTPVFGPDGRPTDMQMMVPSELYDITAEFENGTVKFHDRVWERMETGDISDPDGTGRRAVVEGHMPVSPPTALHTTHRHEVLDALVETYLE